MLIVIIINRVAKCSPPETVVSSPGAEMTRGIRVCGDKVCRELEVHDDDYPGV